MPKKKTRGQRTAAAIARPPAAIVNGLRQADDLMRRKQPFEARELLLSLDRRYPNNPDVLGMLVNASHDLGDTAGYQQAIERLSRLTPDDADVLLGLAGAYLLNVRPVLALRSFRRFLERFPDHPRASEARKTAGDLENGMQAILGEIGLPEAEGREVAELHEQVQSALGQGDFAQVRQLSEQLLRLKPDFVPVLNNLSQAYMLDGHLDLAITAAERALGFDPGNVHALANLVIYHCQRGRLDEARDWAERLKRSDRPAADRWTKVAEALSYLGDDAGVQAALRAAEREGDLDGAPAALLYHLAAVAELRLGREAEARRHWKRALKLNPGLEPARENLDDLSKPVGERHAPWPFAFGNWVARRTLEQVSAQVGGKKREQAITNATRRFLQQHPETAAIVPLLLDRGDPQARQFALLLARTAGTPELLAALRDFALSQRGPDALRHEAAQFADSADLFPDRKLRMWVRGEWADIQLMGFEISGEPDHPHSPKVEPLIRRATEALHARQAERAEDLLEQALELEPDSPSLLNNLAMAYVLQGRDAEGEALVADIHERFPDYLFARVSMARIRMRERDFAGAEELLKPMLARRKLHYSEANALFSAQVELYEAQGNADAAKTWLDMWASVSPDHPEVARRKLLQDAGGRLEKLLGQRR